MLSDLFCVEQAAPLVTAAERERQQHPLDDLPAAADGWRHIPGYAMVIVQSSSRAPGYSYTWAQALVAGADWRRRT